MRTAWKITFILSGVILVLFILLRQLYMGTSMQVLLEMMAIIGPLFPIMIHSFLHFRIVKSKESMFPTFMADVANNLEIGISLPDTMNLVRHNDYRALTKDVHTIYKQMTWGRNFSEVFAEICVNSGSSFIKKAGLEILATLEAGGELSKVLLGVAQSMQEYQNVLRDRRGQMYEQVLTGYMVFFIFLGIIFVILTQLVPMIEKSPLGIPSASPEVYRNVLFHFCLVEAVCISMVTGMMGEGSMTAGFKHALILMTATVAIFTFLA